MNTDRLRAFCPRCQHVQLFKRMPAEHRWHLLITVLTVGLWLVSWLSAVIVCHLQPWRCPRCDLRLPRNASRISRSSASRGLTSRVSETSRMQK
jgi:phage FluMu protein Com